MSSPPGGAPPFVSPAGPEDPSFSLEEAGERLATFLPEFAGAAIERLGRGWDADAFLVGGEWVLRFPRHEDAARAFERELVFLDWLAPQLPLAIPRPEPRLALPSGIADWRAVMSRLIPGRTVTDAGLGRAERAALARPLGRFVAALHALDPQAAPAELPPDPYARFDLAQRLPKALAALDALSAAGELGAPLLHRLRERIAAGPPPLAAPGRRCVLHSDLHRRNLLVDGSGALCGAIDWVDLHQGERAADLYALFVVLPPEAYEDFLEAYGAVPRAELDRARWRAAVHMTLALHGSLQRADEVFAASCRSALGELLEA